MPNETIALPRSAAEVQGVSSAALLDFLVAAEREIDALHSFMLVRHGAVIAEGWWAPYVADRPHMLFSLSKSFTSTAAGLAVAEGRFTLDDKVVSFFSEDLPAEVSENLAAMRVRDLLAMATGNAEDTTGYLHRDPEGNWVKAFLARPVEKTPGTHFVYNSGATYMVAAIVQKTTGASLIDYLIPRLFEPLGIVGATWESCPRGINVGGWGLKITTDDIAKFGQLYLQKGIWNGVRLLPEGWVEEATAKQVSNGDDPNNDWNQGYGYQFWRCRHNAYRGDGAFGQYCVVMPDQDAVIAITSGLGNMGAVLNLIWDRLLPAMQDAPLPANETDVAPLSEKLTSLRLPGPTGEAQSSLAAQVSGTTYRFPTDDKNTIATVRFDFSPDGVNLTITNDKGTHTIASGVNGEWHAGQTTLDTWNGETAPTAASGAWTAGDTYDVICYYAETPFRVNLRARFQDGKVELTRKINVGFGPTDPVTITGERHA